MITLAFIVVRGMKHEDGANAVCQSSVVIKSESESPAGISERGRLG